MEIQISKYMCDPKGFWVSKIAIFIGITKKAEVLNHETALSYV